MDVTELCYRGYTIKAAKIGASARAVAFRNGQRHQAAGATVEAALTAARAWIDAERAENQANQTRDGGAVIGSQADFEHALGTVKINARQLAMLKAHCRAPEHTLSALELARAAGYSNHAAANSMYGRLGRDIGEAADLQPPPSEDQDVLAAWTGVLAGDAGHRDENGHFLWRMHEPLVRAMQALNMG